MVCCQESLQVEVQKVRPAVDQRLLLHDENLMKGNPSRKADMKIVHRRNSIYSVLCPPYISMNPKIIRTRA